MRKGKAVKRFIIFLMAAAAVFAFCGCASTGGKDSPKKKPPRTESSAKATLSKYFTRHERVSEQDIQHFHNQDFEVYPGLGTGSRSEKLHESEGSPLSLW